MKRFLTVLGLLLCFVGHAQQELLFSFAESPQTLLLNPGAETNFSYHYGIPYLNNLQVSAGATSFSLADLFLDDGGGFTDKVKSVVNSSNADDFLNVNLRNDLLFGGIRYDRRTYISFGFYQEADFIFYLPKDILNLVLYGNGNYINENFALSQLAFKGTLTGVLHAGFSRKVNEQFNFGARVKIYSSSANVETTNNAGVLRTFENSQNILRQSLNNVDLSLRSSGFFNSNDDFLKSPNDLFTRTFFGGNLGLGFDLGFTYHFTPQLELSASALDIGFIRYTKDIRNFGAEGDFVFDGINLQFDEDNSEDYWDEIQREFDEKIEMTEDLDPYTSFRPMGINAALKYSFGDRRPMDCFTATRKDYYTNAIGFQVHSIIRPNVSQLSFTSFFENSFSENLHVKVTHTINNFSNSIFGAALAFRWRTLNFVGSIDNISQVRDLEFANTIGLNLGINFVIR